MQKYAVVTITNNKVSEPIMQSAMDSIKANLPPGTAHIVLNDTTNTPGDHTKYYQLLLESLQVAEYICYVDDDDLVVNNSIAILQQAIEATGADMAFTDEIPRNINVDAPIPKTLPTPSAPSVGTILGGPLGAHHLCMFRTAAVDVSAVTAAVSQIAAPYDWVFRAWIAAHGKIVHVPIVGYVWRQRPGQRASHTIRERGLTAAFSFNIASKWKQGVETMTPIPKWLPPPPQ